MLELKNIGKKFGKFDALKSVSLVVEPGQVVGLVGENGAGKSTLMKILNGTHQPDSGSYSINSKTVKISGPRHAANFGIGMVYQEQSLIPNLTIAENIFLGQEKKFTRFGKIDWAAMKRAGLIQMNKVELDLDPFTPISELTFMQRQMVELAKVLTLEETSNGDLFILLDEPTSVLEAEEIKILFSIIRKLKSRAGFIFVSHRLEEVIEVSDTIYVLKDGESIAKIPQSKASPEAIHKLMVGREAAGSYYREGDRKKPADKIMLKLTDVAKDGAFSKISFEIRAGEILALVGTEGAGSEPIMRAIFGLEKVDHGEIEFDQRDLTNGTPHNAVSAGIGYVPRERKIEGIIERMTVEDNVVLPNLTKMTKFGLLDFRAIKAATMNMFTKLGIRAEGRLALVSSLSGGNQQKVVLARWHNTKAKLYLLDHPTRGLDVGAKEDVYDLIREICDQGSSVLLIADTLEEAIGLSHNIIVLKDGKETARFTNEKGPSVTPVQLVSQMV